MQLLTITEHEAAELATQASMEAMGGAADELEHWSPEDGFDGLAGIADGLEGLADLCRLVAARTQPVTGPLLAMLRNLDATIADAAEHETGDLNARDQYRRDLATVRPILERAQQLQPFDETPAPRPRGPVAVA